MGLSFGLSYYTHSKFFDYAFFVGLIVTVMIWFFTSKGGVTSRSMDGTIQGATGIKSTEHHKFEFSLSPSFVMSLIYTVFTFVAMLYQYRDYILK